jgi:hypothetical protein
MTEPLPVSELLPEHIGSVVTLMCYGNFKDETKFEITGRLLAFQRTFDARSVKTITVFIEGANKVPVSYGLEHQYGIQVHTPH